MPQLPNRILLEGATLCTPGLVLFGRSRSRCAQTPLSPHTHPGCLEMVVVHKGCERYMVGDPPVLHEVRGGEVFLTQVDQIHGTGASEQGISEFLWFQLSVGLLETTSEPPFLGLVPEQANALRARLGGLASGRWQADRLGMRLLDESFHAYLDMPVRDVLLAQSLFVAALIRLIRSREFMAVPDIDPRIAQVMAYIGQHVNKPLEIRELSEVSGLSASAFKRLFVRQTGQTPREYVNAQKIDRARILLAQGVGVTETAMALGFSGSDYFSVVFRRHTAMSPTAWMRRSQG